MPSHLCACHYGPDGLCIWCKMGVPDKVPHVPGVQDLPPPVSYGDSSSAPTYIPFSPFMRRNAQRSAVEALGQDLAFALGLLSEDELVADQEIDPILGTGKKSQAVRPLPRSGPWFDFSTDCRK